MNHEINQAYPTSFDKIEQATRESGFSMASEPLTGSILRSLAASKPRGHFLELGTGTGLSTSWILEGMTHDSTLLSIDFDEKFLNIAQTFLANDQRLQLILADGASWISNNLHLRFDYIFADTWHGKYLLLDEVLNMLNPGGIYIVDDMLPQLNWPDGHAEKADVLVARLDQRKDLFITKLNWATGIIIGVKI